MPAPLSKVANGTERVSVVMTPAQKLALQARARRAGMSISDYVRQQTVETDDLAPLLAELRASTRRAELALDSVFKRLREHEVALPGIEAAAHAAVIEERRA